MIMTRSPLRISLGGGGTDLPSYYREHGGFVIAAAINRYVYITLHEAFGEKWILKYSSMEVVDRVEEASHPLMREALRLMSPGLPTLEITSLADIPSGSGLGSSGSFLTALLRGLHAVKKNFVPPIELAEQACHIEMDVLREPVGKQDPYIASFGGLASFEFLPSGQVEVQPLRMDAVTLHSLEDNLALFFTGFTRTAGELLRDQDTRSKSGDQAIIDNLHFTKQLGYESKKALEGGDLRRFAELMNIHWERKRVRSGGMSNAKIDAWYELARRNGALGGKLIGAGGGGFLMFYTEDKTRLRQAMRSAGLREVRVRFDFDGTTVVSQ
jgi:D-glycero-alpha-D-manno-heptose-7-phosphate kinase